MSERAPRITRRTMLGGAAAAGAGMLLGPVAEAAARTAEVGAGGQAGRVFGRFIGHVDRVVTVDAARRFALVGVQWAPSRGVRIQLRTRTHGGRWGPWALASVTGHDPDRGTSPDSAFGEPVWVGAADVVQLRSSRAVDDVTVHFVAREWAAERPGAVATATSAAATAATLPLAGPQLDAGPGEPPIIARSVWAGGHAPPAGPAFYGTIKMAFVHHTDNPNGYSAGEVPALLLAMFDYHRYVRHYFDIAYNFIIDAFGRIWEARAGGIDEPVIGAHAGGYNNESTGVAVLGTFMSVVPPPAAIGALEQLLAWKLALHGVPALGKAMVVVDPAAAFYTPFRPGAHVLLPRVAGHRDGDLTDCPGNDFYDRLPAIRPRIAALEGVPTVLTVTAPGELVAPAIQLTVGGRLTQRDGPPIASAPIEIQELANDRATTIGAAVTAADGSWSATVPLQRGAILRALHPVAPAAASNVISVGVKPVLTLSLASPPQTTSLQLTGTIAPPKPKVTLDVYRLVGGRRRLIHSRRLATVDGRFSATALAKVRPGTFVLIARTGAGHGTLPGASVPLQISL